MQFFISNNLFYMIHFFNPTYLPHHKQIISQVDMRNQATIRATAVQKWLSKLLQDKHTI